MCIRDREKTDAIREAFGDLHGAYTRKDENWREYLDKSNEVLMDTEKNYTKEMEKLHQKQFESPVSYTHLDVYKRQVKAYWILENM